VQQQAAPPKTTKITKDQAVEYRFYGRLNLLKSEVTGNNGHKLIMQAWKVAMKLTHPDAGGSPQDAKFVNMAKEFLTDPVRREDYNNALEVHGLNDGQQKDPNFEANLKSRQNKGLTEVH